MHMLDGFGHAQQGDHEQRPFVSNAQQSAMEVGHPEHVCSKVAVVAERWI